MKDRLDCRAPYGTWRCSQCGVILNTRRELFAHGKSVHPHDGHSWNYGKTAETCTTIRNAVAKWRAKYSRGEIHINRYERMPLDIRLKISESMKLAHTQGRAHNIGESRWNNLPSYPEQFFTRIIEQNIHDKQYIREYPFCGFSLDFAWVHLKRCIEIDGSQHQRFLDNRIRDRNKDIALQSRGWLIMRIPWNDMFANPQLWVQKTRSFIDGVSFPICMFV